MDGIIASVLILLTCVASDINVLLLIVDLILFGVVGLEGGIFIGVNLVVVVVVAVVTSVIAEAVVVGVVAVVVMDVVTLTPVIRGFIEVLGEVI